ncbi:hypothetical protein AB0M43_34670 [Longispora sp. NPDC051575]|uniref:hypothetical protein n=1 Tax=Longispora sp. NPDC051575 TaxID=3154943 RepID=UPI00342084E1
MNTTVAGFRLHYMDDSGSAASGIASFTWLQLHPAAWVDAEQAWSTFRAELAERHAIPAHARLHATELASGRRSPSLDPNWDVAALGVDVIREALEVVAAIPEVAVATVYRRAGAAGHATAKKGLYETLVHALDADLRATGQTGIVFMDGDGSDTSYRAAHQTLPPGRHLIEAPVFRHAAADQWVQMADIAAWSAFQTLRHRAHRGRRMWSWYPTILGPVDLHHGPRPL